MALVRDREKTRELPAVEILEGDLSLLENVRTVLPACDAVIHVAGVVMAHRVEDYERFNFTAVKQLDEKQYKLITAPGFVCSASALSRDTGWKPQFDLSQSLAKAAAGFRKAQWL